MNKCYGKERTIIKDIPNNVYGFGMMNIWKTELFHSPQGETVVKEEPLFLPSKQAQLGGRQSDVKYVHYE